MLAVSVGTVHGLYTGKAQIQHQRLKQISAATGVPLVLHGGTGVSDEDMRLAVTEGINKVNVGTEMNVQWVDRCKTTFEKGKVNDSVRKFLIPANQAVTEVLMEKMALFK
ncbi:ketose-bisphosphate aldolase [Klebsiella quasipneumoniae]|nr:ketose-bisphosphate aldolase [Klebsiella quasipneumoniae]